MAHANARQWQRFSYQADVQLRWGAAYCADPALEAAVCGGRAVNLSQGGLQLRAPDAPSVGAAVSCELSCAGRWTALPGRVRWRSQPPQPDLGTELGIEFGPLSSEQCDSVRELLASLDASEQAIALELPQLQKPLPARALLTDRGVRLRAKLPMFDLGAELDFELAEPASRFTGRVVGCELQRNAGGWELELLLEQRETRDAPRSRRYTMYQLPPPRHGRDGSRRSTLTGATSTPAISAVALEASLSGSASGLGIPQPIAADSGSPLMAASDRELRPAANHPPSAAVGAGHGSNLPATVDWQSVVVANSLRLSSPGPSALATRPWSAVNEQGMRPHGPVVEQPRPTALALQSIEQRSSNPPARRDRRVARDAFDTDEFPRVPKARAPRLISQLLAVLLGFSVAITLGRAALREDEEEEGALGDDAPFPADGADDTSSPAAFVPSAPLTPNADAVPKLAASNPSAPLDVPVEQNALVTDVNAATAQPSSAPHPIAAVASPAESVPGSLNIATATPHDNSISTNNTTNTAPSLNVADRPTVQVTGDTTEVFVPIEGELTGWRESVWVEPIALVIELPPSAHVALPRQRFAQQKGGVTFVGVTDLKGVTQVRVFLDGLLGRYAIQPQSRGLMIRLKRDLRQLP